MDQIPHNIYYKKLLKRFKAFTITAFMASFFALACTSTIDLPPIEEHIASPIDVAAGGLNGVNKFFFVLNSNLNHTYSDGSILVMNKDGSKKSSISIPRLGRSIKIAGNRLIVTFDADPNDKERSKVMLFQIDYTPDPELPTLTLQKEWMFDDCRALNSVLHSDYKHFAVACESGKLLLGTFPNDDLTQARLVTARRYPSDRTGYTKRAMFIDSTNNLLYAFMIDMNTPKNGDSYKKDTQTWNKETESFDNGANDIPDEQEKSKARRSNLADKGNPFQYVIIDLNDTNNFENDEFKFREFKDIQDELYWMNFKLQDLSDEIEQPEPLEGTKEENKYFRSNFWEALPDPNSTSSFYLSHRGGSTAPHANNVVHVTLKAGVNPREQKLTQDIFDFKRIYGFKNQRDAHHQYPYLGAFAFTKVNDTDVLIVNHFRSRKDFGEDHFSIQAIKGSSDSSNPIIFKNNPFAARQSSKISSGTYYQFAICDSDDGEPYVLTSLFYNDSLKIFKLNQNNASPETTETEDEAKLNSHAANRANNLSEIATIQ